MLLRSIDWKTFSLGTLQNKEILLIISESISRSLLQIMTLGKSPIDLNSLTEC